MQKNNGRFSGVEEKQPKKQPEAVLCYDQTMWVLYEVNKSMPMIDCKTK